MQCLRTCYYFCQDLLFYVLKILFRRIFTARRYAIYSAIICCHHVSVCQSQVGVDVRSRKPFKFWCAPTISLERMIVSGAVNLGGRSV